MDLVRLSRLFSGPCPMGLAILHHLDPLRARWAGGREGSMWPRAAGLIRLAPAAFNSSLSRLSLGPRSQKNTGSLSSDPGQPSPTATQEEGEEESFGTLSDKYSSRRMFHKSTAQLYNLRLKEQSGEEDEEGGLQPESRQGPRNTPYWYFFQCKRLIKEGKVGNLWILLLLAPASTVLWYFVMGRPTFQSSLNGGMLRAPLSLSSLPPRCCTRRPASLLAFSAPSFMLLPSSCYQLGHPMDSPSVYSAASSPSPLYLPSVACNFCSQL